MRHEIWQFSWNYGAWQKERRTRVLDRILMHRDQLRKWTWLWDAKLGGVEVTAAADDPFLRDAAARRQEAPGAVPVLKNKDYGGKRDERNATF